MEKFKGTWLMIKTGFDHFPSEVIEFENENIIHYKLEKTNKTKLIKTIDWTEKISDLKYEFINANRIRIYRMVKTHKFINDTEYTIEDIEQSIDYEKIFPTKTELKAEDIEKLEFKAEWNDEKIRFIFNKDLTSPALQEFFKQKNIEGQKLVLENLQETYFASVYDNGKRKTLIGIKEIDLNKALLFGFPEEPYEILAK